jgi:hypothetical protein
MWLWEQLIPEEERWTGDNLCLWTRRRWHSGVETCSSEHLSWIVLYCLYIIVFYWVHILIYILNIKIVRGMSNIRGPRQLSRYTDWLRAGWSGDQIPVGARFFARVQTSAWAHPASCTMDTGSFLGVKRPGRVLTTHPCSSDVKKGRTILLSPLWAFDSVTG